MAQTRTSREQEHEFEQLVQDYIHDTHYASAVQATCNVVYTIINAGIVMLPFAARTSGIYMFSLYVATACLISGYTSVMLVKMANDRGISSYEDLGELAFGKKGFYAISFLQICFSALVTITYVFAGISFLKNSSSQ